MYELSPLAEALSRKRKVEAPPRKGERQHKPAAPPRKEKREVDALRKAAKTRANASPAGHTRTVARSRPVPVHLGRNSSLVSRREATEVAHFWFEKGLSRPTKTMQRASTPATEHTRRPKNESEGGITSKTSITHRFPPSSSQPAVLDSCHWGADSFSYRGTSRGHGSSPGTQRTRTRTFGDRHTHVTLSSRASPPHT